MTEDDLENLAIDWLQNTGLEVLDHFGKTLGPMCAEVEQLAAAESVVQCEGP